MAQDQCNSVDADTEQLNEKVGMLQRKMREIEDQSMKFMDREKKVSEKLDQLNAEIGKKEIELMHFR
jgi:septal ring factor EnvC (AmiA/AmiB activator)